MPFGSDARKEDEVIALVEQIESTIGPIEVLVFNIGANAPSSVLDETARKYFKIWEMACFGGFLNGREVARRMVARAGPQQRQTILFTGATASLRGGAGFAAFAGAKHALRALAQSMARELGPRGIHVAHAIIDGAIDTAFIRDNFPERYALKDQDGILNPDHIADAYWMLHAQPRDAWTHELDLRPYMEKILKVATNRPPSVRHFDFWFDFGSPAAYLAWTQLPQLCADTGASVVWRPMLLGGVFQATGNHSPVTVPAKGKYVFKDLARFARRYGVPLNPNPFFPINTITADAGGRGPADARRSTIWRLCGGHVQVDLGRCQEHERPRDGGGGPAGGGLRCPGHAGLTQDAAVKEQLKTVTAGGGRARRLWRAHLLCRQHHVLGPGPARLRA